MPDNILTRSLRFYDQRGISALVRAAGRFTLYCINAIRINLCMYAGYIRLTYEYETLPGPHHTIIIDPREVNKILFGFSHLKHEKRFGFSLVNNYTYVRDGEWDTDVSDKEIHLYGFEHEVDSPTLYRYDQYIFAQSLEAHFEDGVPWEETRLYEYLIENREIVEQRSENYSNLEERLSEIDDLYDDILHNGYQSQKEIRSLPIPLITIPPSSREVKVAIGRDGEIIFVDGRHRFVIARVLGLKSIPAKVILRHEEWMGLRREFATKVDATAGEIIDHPDLDDLS